MNLEELRKAYKAATPGEWVEDEGRIFAIGTADKELLNWPDENADANAHFVVLAHNAFPALLAVVELCELMLRTQSITKALK